MGWSQDSAATVGPIVQAAQSLVHLVEDSLDRVEGSLGSQGVGTRFRWRTGKGFDPTVSSVRCLAHFRPGFHWVDRIHLSGCP